MTVDFKEYSRRMDKALEHLDEEFASVRAGRANAKVLDRITVEYYGSETPLNGVATISAPDARTLIIQPWDTKLLKDIQKVCLHLLILHFHKLNMKALRFLVLFL